MRVIHKEDVKALEDTCGEIREIYQSDNLSITTALFKPNTKATAHKHEIMEEIYYVLRGRGKIELDKDVLDIRVGDTIPIPKGIFHAAINPYAEDMELLVVTHPRYLEDDLLYKNTKRDS